MKDLFTAYVACRLRYQGVGLFIAFNNKKYTNPPFQYYDFMTFASNVCVNKNLQLSSTYIQSGRIIKLILARGSVSSSDPTSFATRFWIRRKSYKS